MESNVTLIRNLIEDNKTYRHVSEILGQNFLEVTRGFSERNVRLFCAKYGAPNERYTDVIGDSMSRFYNRISQSRV